MAKFIFKMQNLLNIKNKIEEQIKAEYALANKQYQEELEKLDELKSKEESLTKRLKELYTGKISLLDINIVKNGIEHTKDLIKKQEIAIEKARKRLEAVRERLNNAMRERKMYESLREKAFEEFLEEIKYEEGKETDEIVSYKYGRRALSEAESENKK